MASEVNYGYSSPSCPHTTTQVPPSASHILHPTLAWGMGMHLASGIWHLAPCIQHTASCTLNPKERTWIEPPLEEGGSNRCSSYCVLFGGKGIALHLSFSPASDHAWLVYQWSPVSHWDTKWQSYLACKHSSPEGIVYSHPLYTMVKLLMAHKAKYPIYSIEPSFSSVLIYRMRPCPYARQQSAADFALIAELQLQRYWQRKKIKHYGRWLL